MSASTSTSGYSEAASTSSAPPLQSLNSTRRRTPSTSSRGGNIVTDDDEDHDDYLEGDELDEDDEGDHDPSQMGDGLDETTIKSGYLWKKGEKRKNWKKRWFVLRSSKLAYYKNEKEYQLLRLLDMSEVHTVASVAMKKNENCFGIVTPKRTYYVKASSNSEMQSWIENLTTVKTQLQMRSTLTQELAAVDISEVAAPIPNPAPTKVKRSQSKERSPNVSESSAEGASSPSRPKSITIPGQGTYVAPAQPRPIPSPGGLSIPNNRSGSTNLSPQSGGQAFSPLTSTSVSGGSGGSDNGAEHYGLSYQSSAGFSASGSPPRGTIDLNNNLSHSPQSTGETSDAGRHMRANSKTRNRSRGEGSSDGGGAGDRPVSPSKGISKSGEYFGSPGTGVRHATTPGAAGALSSSDEEEDDEGEDWDDDETADQAMPLPGLIPGPISTTSQPQPSQSLQTPQSSSANTKSPSNPQVRTIVMPPSHLKDPSKVIMQGYLMKQSSRRKHWRKRWFVLNGKDLTYSRSHMDSKNNRQIPLSSILDAIEYTSKKGNAIGIHSSPISPTLASPSAAQQSFSFNNDDSMEAKNGAGTEREGHQKERTGEENKAIANSSAQPSQTPQPPKAERRTSLVAAAANIGERIGGASHNSRASDQNNGGLSTSPNLGGTSPLPSSNMQNPKKRKENCFKIITPKRTFVVCAPTEEEEIKWLGAIQALLSRSRGSTTTTVANSNPPMTQTAGFTLNLPKSISTTSVPQQPNEASNSATDQSPSQRAPVAGGAEEENSLPMP